MMKQGFEACIVGGSVRDVLANLSPGDFDIATSASPDQVEALAASRGWKTIPVGKSFGVIRVLVWGDEFEVASYRSEGEYLDGRHPDLSRLSLGCSLEEDVLRRDFTINGLALVPHPSNPTVIDYVGGLQDLRAGLIRTIGEPRTRFEEDALRPLRGVRFAAVLGFQIEARTLEAMTDLAGNLKMVSGERIRNEFEKAVGTGDARTFSRLLSSCGMWEPALGPGAGKFDTSLLADLLDGCLQELPSSPGLELYLALLSCSLILTGRDLSEASLKQGAELLEQLHKRLKLSTRELRTGLEIIDIAGSLLTLPDLITQVLLFNRPEFSQGVALARALLVRLGGDYSHLTGLQADLEALPEVRRRPPEFISGRDLITLGLTPGPVFKDLIDKVRDLTILGEVSDRDQALARLKALIAQDFSR